MSGGYIPNLPPLSSYEFPSSKRTKVAASAYDSTSTIAASNSSISDSDTTPRPTSGKKQSSMSAFIATQLETTSKRIQFIINTAPDTIPRGYYDQLYEVETLTIEMNRAADDYGDYDLAAELKRQRDDMATAAALEKKLFTECTWAQAYAQTQIQKHRKLEKFSLPHTNKSGFSYLLVFSAVRVCRNPVRNNDRFEIVSRFSEKLQRL